MINEFEWNRMIAGEMYSPYKVGSNAWSKVQSALMYGLEAMLLSIQVLQSAMM
ncbi:MAG: hypothetical protein K6E85_16400 [Lachnospiraceae bacterium]|nr:hypothetical protein [Lachnospiraceae bacterium]